VDSFGEPLLVGILGGSAMEAVLVFFTLHGMISQKKPRRKVMQHGSDEADST
jgi:hypothetical protein